MHSSRFFFFFTLFFCPPTTCLRPRWPGMDLWMALSDEPLWTSRTVERRTVSWDGIRTSVLKGKVCIARLKHVPRLPRIMKERDWKKKAHNKAAPWQDWAKQPASAAAVHYRSNFRVLNIQGRCWYSTPGITTRNYTKKNQRTGTREC